MKHPIQLLDYKLEVKAELKEILNFWTHYAVDNENDGFYGKIDLNNRTFHNAPKGAVLNSRILWTYASAYLHNKNPRYNALAKRAFNYLRKYFIDEKFGGVYWALNFKGNPLETKKQIYALAFAIYGLCEYYKIGLDSEAKNIAINLFHNIEDYSFDSNQSGYLEAFTREWNEITDARLSKKDANEKKTMNTHLHIMEAYTNLYRIWDNQLLKEKIQLLINNFTDHILNSKTNHLGLFFTENWVSKSTTISYGHDIEASWLLQEAAEAIHDNLLINKTKKLSLSLANATIEGIDKDGGLWYEKTDNHYIKQKHWWPQAEAMVGFLNAYQNSGKDKFLKLSSGSWQFVKKYIKSPSGEWYWGINEDYSIMKQEDKASFWKCPYHNSRACLEVLKRITLLEH